MFFDTPLHARTGRAYLPAARAFDRNFERFLSDAFFAPARRAPQVQQDDKTWTVTLDLPGVAPHELTVDVEGNVVTLGTIEGAKRPFRAVYELPEAIDADSTSAKLENGVLTLALGKKQPVSNVRRIEVK